jgi:cytoskeletal protein CcmA (bactofilin family)
VSFFKKKAEELSQKPNAPFETEPKALGNQPVSSPLTGDSFASRVAGAAMQGGVAPSAEVGFDRFGKLRSALGPGTVIQGKLSFDTPVRIDGKLSGEIYSSQAIIVGAGGSVEGDIEVASLIVLGLVRGKVVAHDRIEVLQGGRLEADFAAPIFTMEEGGLFNGRCSMGRIAEKLPTGGSGISVEVSKESVKGVAPSGGGAGSPVFKAEEKGATSSTSQRSVPGAKS